MPNYYPSKVDLWLAVVLVLAMALAIVSAFGAVTDKDPTAIWLMALVLVPAVLLPAWVLLGTNYVLDQGLLRIRCGPFRWTVPIAEIQTIEPTRSPISSPALSLDRLRISYSTNKSILISPRDARQFINDLEAMRKRR